ncbi:MAG: ArsA family ATPase [Deltaproteobacteria bacterium]|nr:ArsA family ATPase [Deltaproteobacteria bacterium]
MIPESFDRRIILIGGPGGVGKTTLAAALGIRFAENGFDTMVLTVDPARRLASALGLGQFDSEIQEVQGPWPAHSLFASMLESKRYFDRLIERFAANEAQKNKILNNSIYRTLVDSLGGSHEYAAMERLLEFSQDSRYKKIVVDTPPSQNAVDLLTAPQRLADFMDNSVLRWFQGSTPRYLQLFKQGTKLAMKVLRRILSAQFIDSFSKFLEDIDGMQAGFRTRHLQVLELLRSPQTAFLLVTEATEERFLESVAFSNTLREYSIELSGIILNRISPPCHSSSIEQTHNQEALPKEALMALFSHYQLAYERQQKWIEKFQNAFQTVPLFELPKTVGGIHEVVSLSKMGHYLIS